MPLAKLRAKIYEKYGNVRKFEQATGVSQQYMSRVLRGIKKPGWETMNKLIGLLGIDSAEVGAYFFPEKFRD